MQASDLKKVAKLFEKAGKADKNATETAQEDWKKRFEEYVDQQMKLHAGRLKIVGPSGVGGDPVKQKIEGWRARFMLFTIVDQRLDTVLSDIDTTIAQVVRDVRESKLQIFQELTAEMANRAAENPGIMPDEPISLASSEMGDEDEGPKTGGIAAFAKLRRKVSGGSQAGEATASPAATERTFRGLSVNTKAYEEGFQDDATWKDPGSPGMSTTRGTPHSLIYGTVSASGMRGGPATLGAGPQDYSIRKPEPISTTSYTRLHEDRLTKKKSNDPNSGVPPTRPGKDLSLRQLREVIQSVYESKKQHDQHCKSRQVMTETMEQHLYKYLGKRYEKKYCIQEWTNVIFKAVQKFASREADVAVFGKILRNTLAESFPDVQEQLKESLEQQLKAQISARYPTRPTSEIESIYRARFRSGVPLAECAEVVKFMYNDADGEKIMITLRHISENPMHDNGGAHLAPDTMCMKDLQQVLLSFQMSLTESFLSEFVEIFREIDTLGDGVLKFEQLEELVRRVGFVDSAEDGSPSATVLLEAKNTTFTSLKKFPKGATFSECVDMFTGLISARWGVLNKE